VQISGPKQVPQLDAHAVQTKAVLK